MKLHMKYFNLDDDTGVNIQQEVTLDDNTGLDLKRLYRNNYNTCKEYGFNYSKAEYVRAELVNFDNEIVKFFEAGKNGIYYESYK